MMEAAGRSDASAPLTVGIVAGESSGDQLGAALITALRKRDPQVRCLGVAGPRMVAAGCEAWAQAEELAVMGFTEPLLHLPRLLKLRSMLIQRFADTPLDVFVGIDAPAFNLGLARRLKNRGLPTVQYVSPQVWAWRQGRVKTIGKSVDAVLCLLPFETDFYTQRGVRAEFVGHPLADQIPLDSDRAAARSALNLGTDGRWIALLPGSRRDEVRRLAPQFIAAADWIAQRRPDWRFVAPMASGPIQSQFERVLADHPVAQRVTVLRGQSHQALAACDAAIVASGTATLETMLTGRPMVVAYRTSAITAMLVRALGLVKVRYFSQPNLLTERPLVPEFLQEAVTGDALGDALLREVDDAAHVQELEREFRRVHQLLRAGGADRAAAAVIACAGARQ